MKNILYIGKYNGIIGGIERYMQLSAELLSVIPDPPSPWEPGLC